MFTDSRSIDDRATAASFDTAYAKYAAASESWFDGTPFSVDNRLAQCRRLMHIARTRVARQGADAGPLTNLAALEADARVLTALREDLLTGAYDREDNSPIAGVRIAADEKWKNPQPEYNFDDYYRGVADKGRGKPKDEDEAADYREHYANCGDDEEFAGGEHDEDEYKESRRTAADQWVDSKDGSGRKKCKNCGGVGYGSCVCKECGKCGKSYYGSCSCSKKESMLSPQDRRFVTLESSKFLADNTDTNDARELATRAMHYAQKATSTYDADRSRIVTSAFVASVVKEAEGRGRIREFIHPFLEGVSYGLEDMDNYPTGTPRQEVLRGLGEGFQQAVPPSDESFPEPPPGATWRDVLHPLLQGVGKGINAKHAATIDNLPPEALYF